MNTFDSFHEINYLIINKKISLNKAKTSLLPKEGTFAFFLSKRLSKKALLNSFILDCKTHLKILKWMCLGDIW